MVNWTVTIDGTQVEALFELDYSTGQTDKIGNATIEAGNTATNRQFQSGDEVIITKNGTVDFTGYLTGKPTKSGANAVTLELEAADKRLELKHQQVNRVFYQMDTGAIIREAVNTAVKSRYTDSAQGAPLHRGSTLDGWNATVPILDLGRINSQQLAKAGSDFVFLGFPEGTGSDQQVFRASYHQITADDVPPGQLDSVRTRMIINNESDQVEVEVNFRDTAGTNYNWLVDRAGRQFDVHEFPAEEATTDAQIGSALDTDGVLEYRVRLSGTLPEPAAVGIDHAYAVPFGTESRSTPISTAAVENTGNVVTRRVNRSIYELLEEFGTEDGYYSYIDTNNVLHYQPAGQSSTPKQISYDSTPVVGAEFNRDYRNITNKVTVQGARQIRVSLRDKQSIKFYGISAREEPIVDQEIQTEAEAIRRGKGFLRKHAWDDTAIKFEIADTAYQTLSIGDAITVDWPPEDLQGDYTITEVSSNHHGLVTVALTATDTL